MGKSHVITSIM